MKIKKILKKIEKREKMKKKTFRLQGKHLFLTYPKIKLSRESALEQLKEKLLPRRIEKYVISTEKHKTGDQHLHVYVELDKKSNIENKNRLDLEVEVEEEEREKKHGNYQSCRSYNNVVNYIIKEGKENVLTNMDLDDLGREINIWKKIYEMSKDDEIKETLKKIGEVAPKLMLTDYPKVKKALIEMKNDNRIKKDLIYPEESFNIPKEIKEYMEKPDKTLYLSGGSGIGKTEMMKTLFSKKWGVDKFLRVNNIEGLKDLLVKRYEAIILDDVDLKKLTPEEVLGLLDMANTHIQRILYGTVEIPAGMPRAVLTNKKIEELAGLWPVRQLNGAIRRCIQKDLGNKKVIISFKIEIEQRKEKEEEELINSIIEDGVEVLEDYEQMPIEEEEMNEDIEEGEEKEGLMRQIEKE